ncbi:AraC family transcriptional regulator [Cohnella cholangitidis]|uniref:Helix-turn-helix domain-containing protein n=1 Tax=Cohnella cholangitidis TaxID=2598458 RepID=A0A7G5C1E9_9BACL|nr:helix-turn-helix domain-containing protein [Cohnella cholangitidis]QMV43033.1 helix-turn-helix domain-containing protein [Cohnella cholangitidis]
MKRYRPLQPPKLQRELLHTDYVYREYEPCDKLTSHIACYWTMDFHAVTGSIQPHRILPDGCVDILFDRRSLSYRNASFVAGLMAQYEVMNLTEAQSLFGVRFYSEAARSVFKYPVSEFRGYHVYLEEFWGIDSLAMVEEILSADEVSKVIDIVERKLIKRLSLDDSPSDPVLHASMQYMYTHRGTLTPSDLADKLSFSGRHIRRTFDRELGMSPKEMLSIIRFQSLLQELNGGGNTRLTDIAANFGYYDQSHFIKHFKRYYGLLPREMLRTE